MDLIQALRQLATYQYGQSRESLIAVEDHARDSYDDPERRKQLRERLAALLSSDATTDGKRSVCRQLSIIGTAEEVPALAKLLTDEKLSQMARFALERIPGPAADTALRNGLQKAKGKILIGVINSIGERRDAQAVGMLSKFVTSSDEAVAGAAVAAVGKIGGPEAAKALAKAESFASPRLRPIVVDAYLKCAEHFLAQGKKREAASIYEELSSTVEAPHVRAAALRGLEAAR